MRYVLVAVLCALLLIGCAPKSDNPASTTEVGSYEPVLEPLKGTFDQGTDTTAWLMDMKHTLRGLTSEEAQRLCQDLLALGAVEMRVGDLQPDSADPSFSSAGRMIVRGPKDSSQRRAIVEFADKWNKGVPAQPNVMAEFAEITFPKP